MNMNASVPLSLLLKIRVEGLVEMLENAYASKSQILDRFRVFFEQYATYPIDMFYGYSDQVQDDLDQCLTMAELYTYMDVRELAVQQLLEVVGMINARVKGQYLIYNRLLRSEMGETGIDMGDLNVLPGTAKMALLDILNKM